jgi:response regulator RpfG family c-di-GMP phosphodiesterase
MLLPVALTALVLFVQDAEALSALRDFLDEHQLPTIAADALADLMQILKAGPETTVFVDCQALQTFGLGLLAKIRVAAPPARLVLLCSRSHPHRDLIREALALGAYACVLAPYQDYEVLTLVRLNQNRKPVKRAASRKR